MSVFEGEKEAKKAFLDLDDKEEKLIKEIEKEADIDIQELIETVNLIRDIKNRGLYLLEKMNDLDSVLKGNIMMSKHGFNRKEYISGALDIMNRQLEKLKTEELVALQEGKEEDKLEKFIFNLTKKADKIASRAKKELDRLK